MDGQIAPGHSASSFPVQVLIGNVPAVTAYAGQDPLDVYGVMRIDAVVPPGVPPGPNVPILVEINGVNSQSGVTVALK